MKSNVENSSIINIIYQLKSIDHAREDKIRKCRFNNRGYCKFKEQCKNVHAENVCEDFLQKETSSNIISFEHFFKRFLQTLFFKSFLQNVQI